MRPAKRQLLGYLLIALFGISPVLIAILSGAIATGFGCRVDEGSAHPCIVFGADRGQLFYTLGVLGWLSLGTVPLAFLIAIGYTIYLAVRKRRPASPPGS